MAGLQDLINSRAAQTGRIQCVVPNGSAAPQAMGSYWLNKAKADVKAAADKLLKKEARRDLLIEQRETNVVKADAAEKQLGVFDAVQILLQKTSDYARQQIKGRIEEIVSQALNIVYGGEHKFTIDLVVRGNRPEADYYLFDGNTTVKLDKPDYNQGGGKINIITIALRLGIDELVGDTGPLLLDEIGSNVDEEAMVNLAYFLKEYSAKFNRQIILITHSDTLGEVADAGIRIVKKNGEAKVNVI